MTTFTCEIVTAAVPSDGATISASAKRILEITLRILPFCVRRPRAQIPPMGDET
jgi:hypothetical protein